MSNKIPVFVSRPTLLSVGQKKSQIQIYQILEENGVEARTVGESDFGSETPLKECAVLANACYGGIILGYQQVEVVNGTSKAGTENEVVLNNVAYSTPWNHIEAGIIFALKKPMLIFNERGVSGGIFDFGSTDLFVNEIPSGKIEENDLERVRQTVQHWTAKVREAFRSW